MDVNKSASNHLKTKEKYFWQALSLAWDLGYTIALPLVIFALIGRLLDKWLNTSPWFLLGGIFVSIIISSLAVYFKAVKILKN
jgi:F0F1-type ATP synthase assembly protein I